MKSLALVALFALAGCATGAANLALKKPAFQYSVWDSLTVASNAVDGDLSTHWRKCQVTKSVKNAWWAVDLGDIYTVTGLSILRRSDCRQCGPQLSNFDVVVSNLAPPLSGPLSNIEAIKGSGLCIYQKEAIPMVGKQSLACTSPRNGRYVYIILSRQGDGILTLCEVEVFGRPENLALKKPAFQYIAYTSGTAAGNAVDGDLSTNSRKCQNTVKQVNWAWWAVDLGGIYTVTGLSILRESTCPWKYAYCLNRLSNFDVFVTNTPPPASGPLPNINAIRGSGLCIYQKEGIPIRGKQSLACTSPRNGRYVYIIARGRMHMILCEVEVFGRAVNLALKKPAFQYSAYNNGTVAGNAVDGDLSTNWRKCQNTKSVKNPWWAVDLGDIHTVTSLSILRESDCPQCLYQLSNFDVVVSNMAPPLSGPLSTIEAIKGSGLCIYQKEAIRMFGKRSLACTSPRIGRYVYIIMRDEHILTLCEVEVFGSYENLALRKPTFQYKGYSHGGEVDGGLSTRKVECNFLRFRAKNVWWAVDLVGIYTVTGISILSGDSLRNFDVVVSNTAPPAYGSLPNIEALKGSGLCIYQKEAIRGKQSLGCTSPRNGRYVYIIFRDETMLYLCEVGVFGRKADF